MNGEVSKVRADIEFYAKIAGEEVVIPVKDIETTVETNLLRSLNFS